jgi:hypothetical protein
MTKLNIVYVGKINTTLNNCLNHLVHPQSHVRYQADLSDIVHNSEFVKNQSELVASRFKGRKLRRKRHYLCSQMSERPFTAYFLRKEN